MARGKSTTTFESENGGMNRSPGVVRENERRKRDYLSYQAEACGRDEKTIDQTTWAIAQFEAFAPGLSFEKLDRHLAIQFKKHLVAKTSSKTGKPLSVTTVVKILKETRNFFGFLSRLPGFGGRRFALGVEFLQASTKDRRLVSSAAKKAAPKLEDLVAATLAMPFATPIDRRNRAVMALLLLTGARDDALASLRLKHIDVNREMIFQHAPEVRTKASKSFDTWFFPVGSELKNIIVEWTKELTIVNKFEPNDPLFPATRKSKGTLGLLENDGLSRTVWETAGPVRKIFRAACAEAGLDHTSPHAVRSTLTLLGEQRCRTPEEFKAWSQNLGHDHVSTSFTSYGTVGAERQGFLIQQLGSQESDKDFSMAMKFVELLRRERGIEP